MKTLSTFILILFWWSLPASAQDWAKVPGLAETSFTALATIDEVLFAGSGNQLYYSYDQGDHWQQTTLATEFLEPGCFKKFGNRLYIGMHGQGIFSAPLDHPEGPWTQQIGTLEVSSFAEHQGSLYVSTLGYGIWKMNPDQSWSSFTNGLPTYSYNVSKIFSTAQSLMATAGANGTFYRYDFTGNQWQEAYYGSTYAPGLSMDDALFLNNSLYVSSGRRLWRSDDNGENWVADQLDLLNGLGRFFYQGSKSLYTFTANFNPGNNQNFTYLRKRSIDAPHGSSWGNASDFLPFFVYAIAESGDKIFAAADDGLYFKTDATLGIDIPLAESEIVIYPNLSGQGDFTLNSTLPVDEMAVFDSSGKRIFTHTKPNQQHDFHVSRKGIYLVRVTWGEGIKCIKIISS